MSVFVERDKNTCYYHEGRELCMKKDHYYDYVIEAFRYYASCGKPETKDIHHLRYSASMEQKGRLSDLEAVVRTVERLRTEPDGVDSINCLELVYFQQPQHHPKRNELTQRVENASLQLGLSVSSINRRLKRVRRLMAVERGLRIDDQEPNELFKQY